ncbi:phasin family protein [Hyphococcus sp.]|uniref:phasin family protein n=1 Tax=Hyphococcus sp. TaxID=2038636 RepID=UPI0035C77EFE
MATTTKTAAKKTADAATKVASEIDTEIKALEMPDVMSFSSAADWAESAKEQFETMMSSFTGNFDDMRTQAENLAETAQARMKRVQDHAAKTNACLMEAAQEEMTSAVQFASDLGKAKTFADALSVQQSYWTKVLENRMAHARTLTESSVETARETMTPMETPFANMKAFEKFFAFPAKA